MKKLLLLAISTFIIISIRAQSDPEFKKGFIMHFRATSGLITEFHSTPDLFVGSLQLVPQFTIVEHKIRGGAILGLLYTGKKVQGLFGPTISFKLKTIQAGAFGSAANIHIALDHLWGTEQQQLFGGGLYLDAINRIVIGLTAHRDYHLSTWWIQTSVGIRISKQKKKPELFDN